jgi:hypothetical protein
MGEWAVNNNIKKYALISWIQRMRVLLANVLFRPVDIG